MDPIKNIVTDVIGRLSCGQGNPQEIQAAWKRISGDKGSHAVELKDGCVVVSADSSMRTFKLNLNREALLKELQKEFPSIKKISFKVGSK